MAIRSIGYLYSSMEEKILFSSRQIYKLIDVFEAFELGI